MSVHLNEAGSSQAHILAADKNKTSFSEVELALSNKNARIVHCKAYLFAKRVSFPFLSCALPPPSEPGTVVTVQFPSGLPLHLQLSRRKKDEQESSNKRVRGSTAAAIRRGEGCPAARGLAQFPRHSPGLKSGLSQEVRIRDWRRVWAKKIIFLFPNSMN